jgi:hypothetical protein
MNERFGQRRTSSKEGGKEGYREEGGKEGYREESGKEGGEEIREEIREEEVVTVRPDEAVRARTARAQFTSAVRFVARRREPRETRAR